MLITRGNKIVHRGFCIVVVAWVTAAQAKRLHRINFSRAEEPQSHAKDIVFIRHGESAGNAPIRGALENLDVLAYRDGRLVKPGREQVVDRMSFMSSELLLSLSKAEIILVSPLARAMGTALILIANLAKRAAEADGRPMRCEDSASLPKMEVMAELREKIGTQSDVPGSNRHDARDYVIEVASEWSQSVFGNSSCMLPAVSQLLDSYDREEERTLGWEGRKPTKAGRVIAAVKDFREKLARRPETNIIIVGHNGWSRFAFGAFLPCSDCVSAERALIFGARKVHPLNNCGLLMATFANGLFSSVRVDSVSPGDDKFPNCLSESKYALLFSVAEAKATGVVPQDALMDRFYVTKQMDYMRINTDGFQDRVFTLSATRGKVYLAWSSRWGEPKKIIQLSSRHRDFALTLRSSEGIIEVHTDEVYINDFKLKMDPTTLQQFCALVTVYFQNSGNMEALAERRQEALAHPQRTCERSDSFWYQRREEVQMRRKAARGHIFSNLTMQMPQPLAFPGVVVPVTSHRKSE